MNSALDGVMAGGNHADLRDIGNFHPLISPGDCDTRIG
jgi:hypothetical protein